MRRRSAPTYLFFDRQRSAWHLRFRYVDAAGRIHWPRERSPYPADYQASLQWAAPRRAAIIREIEADVRRVDAVRPRLVTLGEVMAAYEVDARRRLTQWERRESYRAAILVAELGRELPAAELTPRRVAALREQLRAARGRERREGRRIVRDPLSNRSLNAYTTLLHAALAYAASPEVGLLERNPMAGLKRLEEARRTPPALDVQQVAALFAAVEDWRGWAEALRVNPANRPRLPIATRLYLGYYLGGRPESVDRLRWSDVDLCTAVASYRSKGHDVVCPLDPRLVDHLRAVRQVQSGSRSTVAPAADALILAREGTANGVTNWRTAWRRLVHLANRRLEADGHEGIPDAAPIHCLRHSRITHLLQAGMEPQAVAQSTGTSLVMLSRHYAHLMAGALGDALARARRHSSQRLIDAAARRGQTPARGQTPPAGGQSRGQNEARKPGENVPRRATPARRRTGDSPLTN